MSYCVNCGVELERAQKKCPLCGIEVVNPAETDTMQKCTTFPENRDEQRKSNRTFWLKFTSIIAVAPIVTCVLCNLLYDQKLTWSIFVIAGVFMLWAFCSAPFFFKSFNLKKMLFVDFAAVILGLGLIAYPLQETLWYIYVALPIVLYCFLSWLLIVFLAKKKIVRGLGITAALFVSLALMIIFLETLLDLYIGNTVFLVWSWFVTAPCLAIAALLILLDTNPQVKQEMTRRFHF